MGAVHGIGNVKAASAANEPVNGDYALDLQGLDLGAVRALQRDFRLEQLNFGIERANLESAVGRQLKARCASPSSPLHVSSSRPASLAQQLLARFDPEECGLIDALELVSALLLAVRFSGPGDGASVASATPADKAAALFDAFDFEGNGYLEFDDLQLMLESIVRGARAIFDSAARDEDASSRSELQLPLSAPPSQTCVQDMVDGTFLAADADHDGLVHRGEWLEYAAAVVEEMAADQRSEALPASKGATKRLGLGDLLVRLGHAEHAPRLDTEELARATREALEDSIQVLEEMEQVVRAVESIGSADAGDLNAS